MIQGFLDMELALLDRKSLDGRIEYGVHCLGNLRNHAVENG